jgi:signal transduction histidine kinase
MFAQHEESLHMTLTQVFSHEMMTPLIPILAYSERMLRLETGTLPDPDDLRDMSRLIHGSALRLQHLLENYLLYADLQMLLANADRQDDGTWSLMSAFSPTSRSRNGPE